MTGFAIFRMPEKKRASIVIQTQGKTFAATRWEEIDDKRGYVIAPFNISERTPLLILQPTVEMDVDCDNSDAVKRLMRVAISSVTDVASWQSEEQCETERMAYNRLFHRYSKALESGDFRKLVLARVHHVPYPETPKDMGEYLSSLFMKACALYPKQYISLFSTPESGTWLVATPETLLSCDQIGRCYTMALAGTMKAGETEKEWSLKNQMEQNIVTQYIRENLEDIVCCLRVEPAHTVMAASLLHLRSDFHFSLLGTHTVGEIARKLHPTPAVCGIPKHKAWELIVKEEGDRRRYYSGFTGMITKRETNLFVTLRCMRATITGFDLYAGGGIVKDSVLDDEWAETVMKMETMERLI